MHDYDTIWINAFALVLLVGSLGLLGLTLSLEDSILLLLDLEVLLGTTRRLVTVLGQVSIMLSPSRGENSRNGQER
jgi:hypothetical protein